MILIFYDANDEKKMNENELQQMLAQSSATTRRLNQAVVAGVSAAEPQPCAVPALAHDKANEGRGTRRRHVCITARRVRLQDPDNQVVKFIVDGLRYDGVIADDTTDHISLEVRQEKVSSKEKQGTEIVIQ